jgi:50S ribosomal protein L16 3-hydroxylase
MLTGKLTPEQFLKRYWQREPVLLQQALPGFRDPITPEELAGLALEDEIEARLVFTKGKDWTLKPGPFQEKDFTSLAERNWTLLVQSVDQWVPAVKQLLQSVPFIPSWRVDDVMISYATQGGGVGPHFDYYDVFLVQGQGSRQWRIGQHCSAGDELRTDSGLKLLKNFKTVAEYTLNPGDVLYVPPGVAHWGISNDDSLCYSIGFRAPSVADLLLGYSEHLSDTLSADQRYTDPRLHAGAAPGEISADSIDAAWKQLQKVLRNKEDFASWFGASMTEPRFPEQIQPRKKLSPTLLRATDYSLHPASRIAWQEQADKQIELFIDGHSTHWPDSAALRTVLQQLSIPASVVPAAMFNANAVCGKLRDQLLLQGSLLSE